VGNKKIVSWEKKKIKKRGDIIINRTNNEYFQSLEIPEPKVVLSSFFFS